MSDPAFSTLLESLDGAGADHFGKGWDARLTGKLEALAASYGNLRDPDRQLIDYGSVTTHAAYIYTYAQCRADFVYQTLKRARDAKGAPLFDKEELRVCSLGGGPGSELIRLLRYLAEEDNEEDVLEVYYKIYDKERDWEDTASALCDAVNQDILVHFAFEQLDVTDERHCLAVTLAEFHLVILSYFVSEVASLPDESAVISCMNHLLGSVSVGAAVLYCDNDAYTFYDFFNRRRQAAGRYSEIHELKDSIVVEPHSGDIYDDILERTGRNQHLNGKVLAKYLIRT
jgi:hypothetical protein